ncbi:Bug family tripartite tricarboxylate transporter substrate binding protein [Sinosporangium siamense]|uniref:C4-dicarboxylate ABC transporter substrate-binding protein n=1 Tax=Sinosporangium siamense TaxID=1367973 RepID=A0A919V9V6_9ACTN|nr:tripartite tricarboxylate transporter substrate-binding protein [Sinosporangium siamense]GII90499.1 C4-dicarboxylate ABC transporter substrate-binding protein [Sinosporangium siamense]
MRRRRFLTLSGLALCAASCGSADGSAGRRAGRVSIMAAGAGGAFDVAQVVAATLRDERLAAATMAGLGTPASVFADIRKTTTRFADGAAAHGGPERRFLVAGLADLAAAQIDGPAMTTTSVTPLARLVGDAEALVVPSTSKFTAFEDFAAAVKARPAAVPVAGGPVGSADHVLFGMIGRCVGADVRLLDYAGFAANLERSLLEGRAAAAIGPLTAWRAGLARGDLRPLAVSSAARVDGIDAPTMLECGVRVDYYDWRGIVGPPGMSEDDRNAAVDLVDAMAASPYWARACASRGWRRIHLGGDDFRRWMTAEDARIRRSLRELGLLHRPEARCGGICTGRD